MKAETTKRLFKAIASNSQNDMLKLCEKVISEEDQIGHYQLASQLKKIIEARIEAGKSVSFLSDKAPAQTLQLPRSKRDNALLAHKIPFQQLRHHMVLAPSVEERFHRIEQEYAARERLAKFGLSHKKKILLYGAPGCGKTLGAERIAFNVGLPLIKVRFDAIISSYLGDTATNLRTIFDNSSESPCVLLLDECDFIAKSRDTKNDVGEISRTVNMLLTLLDEYNSPGLMIATTNLERNLDSALFRRFDDVIEVPPPNETEIIHILELTLSALKTERNMPWREVAQKFRGRSAATFVRISEEAAKYAILSGRDRVSRADILKAASEVYSEFEKQ